MKSKTTCSITGELLEKAHNRNLNVSGILEEALQKEVIGDITDVPEERICYKCKKNKKEMIWLCPDSHWICTSCMNHKVQKVIIGVVPV